MRLRRAFLAFIVIAAISTGTPAGAAVAGGDVLAFGAPDHGSTEGVVLNSPIVDLAGAPDGSGYWEVASDGGVFSFGGAFYAGSLGNIKLNRPIIGMAPTRTGKGYWLVASDGGVFTFGDAAYLGSTGGSPPPQPVVGIVATPSGSGYWLVTSAGAVYPFGTAPQYGDLTSNRQPQPVVGMASTPTGDGYWLTTSNGGVYTYGRAGFAGSLAGQRLDEPVTGIEPAAGGGYWLVTRDGAVYSFGNAPFAGSAAGACKDSVIGMAGRKGGGYWLVTTPLPAAAPAASAPPLEKTASEDRQMTSLMRIRQGCQPGATPRTGVLAHPLPGARVTTSYGAREHPIYHQPQFHTGVDFAGKPTALSAAAGTVVEVRIRNGYGLMVIVDHGNGISTGYAHLAKVAVSSGQIVKQGQAIGTVGHTGDATGDHLHFDVRVHGVTTDPMKWL